MSDLAEGGEPIAGRGALAKVRRDKPEKSAEDDRRGREPDVWRAPGAGRRREDPGEGGRGEEGEMAAGDVNTHRRAAHPRRKRARDERRGRPVVRAGHDPEHDQQREELPVRAGGGERETCRAH